MKATLSKSCASFEEVKGRVRVTTTSYMELQMTSAFSTFCFCLIIQDQREFLVSIISFLFLLLLGKTSLTHPPGIEHSRNETAEGEGGNQHEKIKTLFLAAGAHISRIVIFLIKTPLLVIIAVTTLSRVDTQRYKWM